MKWLIGSASVLALIVASGRVLAQPAATLPAESAEIAHVLTVKNQAQAGVKDLVEKGLFRQALEDWELAYGITGSPTQQATYDLLLVRNDLQILGLEKLFEIKNPQQISPALRALWARELPPEHRLWRDARIPWSAKWRVVFPANVENTITAWHTSLPKTAADFKSDTTLLSHLALDNPARAWLVWQLALGRGVAGQTHEAAAYLQELLDSDQRIIAPEEIYLATGRLLYQDGKLDGAVKYDNMVPKGSDHWLEALEEKAWADVRKGDYASALSKSKTLLVPFFSAQLGPEPYYLTSLADIRVCDYASVFKTLKTFKENFKDRVSELQKVAAGTATPSVIKALDQLQNDGSVQGMGGDLQKLPRLYQRDDELRRLALRAGQASAEANQLAALIKESPNSTDFSFLKNQTEQDAKLARAQAQSRMAVLARQDVSELSRMLKRLHVVEVEAIQRMFPNPAFKAARAATGKNIKTGGGDDQLIFPNDGEVWLDELSHYQVNAKGCGG